MAAVTSLEAFAEVRRCADLVQPMTYALQPFQAAQVGLINGSIDLSGRTQEASAALLTATAVAWQNGANALLARALLLAQTALGITATSATELLAAWFQYMSDNGIRIQSRGTVNSAPSVGGGNVGSQTLQLCGTDWNGDTIESSFIETVRFTCQGSAQTRTAVGLEQYVVTGNRQSGSTVSLRFLNEGEGLPTPLFTQALSPLTSSVLQNGSWNANFQGTGLDKIPAWTIVGTAGSVTRDTALVAQPIGVNGQASLQFAAGTNEIVYDFQTNGTALLSDVPYLMSIRVRRATGVSGNLTIALGSAGYPGNTTVIDLATLAADTWEQVNLDPDIAGAWLRAFNTDGSPLLSIEVASAGGVVNIDDFLLAPMSPVAGRFLNVVSGLTPAVTNDTMEQTSSLTVGVGSVTLATGASGSVDAITVGGVSILPAPVPYNTSLAQTAADVAAAINSADNVTNPPYYAVAVGAVVNIYQVIPAAGTFVVVSTATTIGTTDVDVTGGAIGTIQDMLVRVLGRYLPHNGSPTAGYGD